MKKLIPKLIGFYFNVMVWIVPKYIGRKAFYLFSSPRRAELKPNHFEFFNTSEKSIVNVDGNDIQIYRWGNGRKVIVFIHGWQSHSYRWRNYIEALSKDEYSIYSIDAPGHGLSKGRYCNIPIYSKAIETFLLTLPDVHTIVSHSLGSMSTLYTFYRNPSLRVRQLIITGTPGEGNDYVKYYQNALGASAKTKEVIREAFKTYADGHVPEFFSAIKFAGSLEIPLLSIHDEGDVETPYYHALAIQAAAKYGQLITTKGLGHNLRSTTVVRHVVDYVENGPSEIVESLKAKG